MAHTWLKKSLELEQKKSRDAVFVVFVSSSISLAKSGTVDESVAIEDYFYATDLIDAILVITSYSIHYTKLYDLL